MDPEAARYIKENRSRYTRAAIEAHLLKAGYSHTEIDASWPPDDQESPPLPQGRAFWRPFILSVTGMYGITFLVYAVSFYMGDDIGIWPVISGILLVFLLLAAMISVDVVKRKRSAWSSGTASSSRAGVAGGILTALLIPFVFLIIVAGLCFALTGVPFTEPNF